MLQAEHLDEGTLHSYLDGELDSDQLAEVDRHLADCAECRRRAEEAQQMLDEADELVDRLEPPPLVMLPESRSMGGGNRLDPVVLIPPEPETPRPTGSSRPPRPNRPFAPPSFGRTARTIGLAAAVVLAVGLGYAFMRDEPAARRDTELARMQAPAEPTMSGFEREQALPAPSTPPVDSAAVALGDSVSDSATAVASAAAGALAADAAEPPAETPRELAARNDAAARRERDAEAAQAEALRRAAEDRAAEAAERDVAARTQAALEQSAARAAPPRAAAAPPPDPMTALERRAGVYSRIGLDEAQRMLGGPAHAILDLRPQFVGLAASSGVPGADPGRPLVRVVYLDPSQRLIILDQQRQSGDLPPSTDNLIVTARGGVRLWLHGAVPPATLRELAQRVR